MEIHQLRYAAEVASRRSFTAAADELHVSQSGVSAQVAKLERELGVRLFERGARIATPTSEGEVLLPHIRSTLETLSRIRTVADDLVGVVRGQVRIGTIIGCTIPGYLTAFAEFRRAHPGVAVSASEGNSEDLIVALATGELDVALVAHADPLSPTFDVHTFIDEPLAVGVPEDHPWATRKSITPRQLLDVDVLTLPPGTGVRSALAKTCDAAGIDIVPAVQAYSPDAALALAHQGVGATVLSASMIGPPLVAVAINGAAHTSLSIATRVEPGAAARAFAQTLHTRLVGSTD